MACLNSRMILPTWVLLKAGASSFRLIDLEMLKTQSLNNHQLSKDARLSFFFFLCADKCDIS